jgi:hypothetical protein
VLTVSYRLGHRYLPLDVYDGSEGRDAYNPHVEFTTTLLNRFTSSADPTPGLERVGPFTLEGAITRSSEYRYQTVHRVDCLSVQILRLPIGAIP